MEEQEERQEHAQALVIKSLASHQTLPVLGEEQVLYLLVEIGPHPALQVRRLPFNLCLVIDRSTSMQGIRLQRVKEATYFIIDFLDEPDIFSLVTFSDRAEVLIAAQPHVDKAYAKARVSTIHSAGGTEILEGIVAGLDQVDRWLGSGTIGHVILLTDGQTYGGEQECLVEAEAAGRRQIGVSTMGIGQDWNDKLLDEIASRSGGTSTYIDSVSKVTSVFRDRIQSLTSVIAQGLNLKLRLPSDVRLQEVFRVSPSLERLYPRESGIPLGPLDSEQPCVLILELLLGRGLERTAQVAQLALDADVLSISDAPSSDRHVALEQSVQVEFIKDLEGAEPVPPSIVSALGKLAIFKMQEKTMEDLERGEIEQASQRLETMATRLLNIGENELAKAALLEAGRLTRTGHLSPEGRKKIRYGTRGLSMLPKEISHG
jgi:secreted protein with Ig-like and vWFA domain